MIYKNKSNAKSLLAAKLKEEEVDHKNDSTRMVLSLMESEIFERFGELLSAGDIEQRLLPRLA